MRSYILSRMKNPSEVERPQSQTAPRKSDSRRTGLQQAEAKLRERKKNATRRALVRAANQRFHSKGFDATTIDEICADAQVSRRTFFRYFANKEALAFPHRSERLERFLELLEGAPLNECPFISLRQIAQVFAREYSLNRDQQLAQQQLINSTPALVARENEIDRDWENAMAEVFIQRYSSAENSSSQIDLTNINLRARLLAGAAIGVIRATLRHWFAMQGNADLASLGAQALDALQGGFKIAHWSK